MHNIPEPTCDYVRQRQREYENNPTWFGADATVRLVFDAWPNNRVYAEVLAKVVVLNRLYSTNIFNVYAVAEHIIALGIDERLTSGDLTLVADLGTVTIGDGVRNNYSFATKYCSFQQPHAYQIYDSYVDWLLWEYKKRFNFAKFKRYELKGYSRFVEIVTLLADRYQLSASDRKPLDKFLWIEGVTQYKAIYHPSATPGLMLADHEPDSREAPPISAEQSV